MARGMVDGARAPGGRQEVGTDTVIELACELRLGQTRHPGGDTFRQALERVWRRRLRDADNENARWPQPFAAEPVA
jgi:hypothetical protein